MIESDTGQAHACLEAWRYRDQGHPVILESNWNLYIPKNRVEVKGSQFLEEGELQMMDVDFHGELFRQTV